MEIKESRLTVPAGTPGAQPIQIDITEIVSLEARKNEVANVTKAKAPELMSAMERGYSAAARLLTNITWEVKKAEDAVEKRKSIVTLEVAPQYLQSRGLVTTRSPGGSEDQRTAVLATDTEYMSLRENVDRLKAVQEYLRVKVKGFEMAFSAIKKVYDTLNAYGMVEGADRKFPGSSNDAVQPGTTPSSTAIGKPRY